MDNKEKLIQAFLEMLENDCINIESITEIEYVLDRGIYFKHEGTEFNIFNFSTDKNED